MTQRLESLLITTHCDTDVRDLTMIRLAIGLLAGLFVSSGLLLLTLFLRSRGETNEGWPPGGVLQLSAIVLTLLALSFALVAFQIAQRTSRESVILPALEPVQIPVEPPVNSSALSQTETEPSPELAGDTESEIDQSPTVELLFDGTLMDKITEPVVVSVGPNGIPLRFVARNTGPVPAKSGTLVIIAEPHTLGVDESSRRSRERWNPHRFQKAIPDILPSPANTEQGFQLNLIVYGQIPETFSLSFSLFGENFEAVRRKLTFRALP